MAAQTFGALPTGLVPRPQAQEILTRAAEQSVVRKLSGTMPMPLTGSAIAVQTGHIEAGLVAEGAAKPVGATSYAIKTITPKKFAAIAVVSDELVRENPAGVWDNISQDIADAITRAFDLAILYGLSAKTGSAIAGVEFVNQTTNRVEIGTATKPNGGISTDLISGYNLVVNGTQVHNGFTGFAATPGFRGQLLAATDVNGRPVYQQSINLRDSVDALLGLPVAYGRAVNASIGAATPTDTLAFGGDWSALKYGFAQNLTISQSDQATVVDGGTTYNLWQQNLRAILVEATFGWAISDVNSFAAYEVDVA